MKYIGFDIGSISLNTVLVDDQFNVLECYYDYIHGRPFHVLKERLEDLISRHNDLCGHLSFTGTGGKLAAELLDGEAINEIVAQSTAVMKLHPEVRTVIEMGGEDSKLIFLEESEFREGKKLSDFNMNNLCAAGTGSFLDQQAKRIGVSIEEEFGALALKSENPPRIAGRCSVFAKSDMIHLQQVATPVHDIIAGLCFAVARNYKSSLGKGKPLNKPVMFQGGVAANKGMVRAFREIYHLSKEELLIPEYHAAMGAIGAVTIGMENRQQESKAVSLDKLNQYLIKKESEARFLKRLKDTQHLLVKDIYPLNGSQNVKAYLGIDVGSLSTNVAVIDEQNNVLGRRYLPTAGKPLEAIKKGLAEVGGELAHRVEIVAVGTTGSGRYLTGDFVGADTIQNEITCQATAAIHIDPEVDTIFEIGGQDSKYIRISNGVIVDFEMNKVCAAGTGSFLEEQADKLGINIIKEFGEKGLAAEHPVKLGERCTVFMESDLNSHQQKGTDKDNLIAGLAYSIVQNYINRVVRDKPIGNKIFFQGGVTNNKAVLAAFEEVIGKKIYVPPHFDITGAIGAAILAREGMNGSATHFKGFRISKANYVSDNFICKSCSNHCEIKRIRIEGEERALYYGGICDKYEFNDRKVTRTPVPDYFQEREVLLRGNYKEEIQKDKFIIGLPRGLMNYYQNFPFWKTFFTELGFCLVVSDETNKSITTKSIETMVSETCLPVELIHGHVLNLIDKGVDYVFLPFIVNVQGSEDNPTNNCNCPWVQSHPYLVKAAFKNPEIQKKLLIPTLHFRYFDRVLKKELKQFIHEKFKMTNERILDAIEKADAAQKNVERIIELQGQSVFKHLDDKAWNVVIIGRPYNTGDPALNLRLIKKLQNMNVRAIPLDYLPLKQEDIFEDYPGMYWPNGQKILQASRIISKTKNLFAIYLSNFRCGPDSFLLHFVKKEMNGKPFLHLEVDEHSADAGMITRIEAFLDSLEGWRSNHLEDGQLHQGHGAQKETEDEGLNTEDCGLETEEVRTIYFPYAKDSVHFLSAATRSCGIPSEVLPMQNNEDLELGRKYTDGQECFPFICTLGSFLRKLKEPGIDPAKSSFFMPDHNGPCRFGEYNKLHRVVFDKLGFQEAEIVHPSNEDAYASIAPGYSLKWRKNCWKGLIAGDLIRKMLEQIRPYEIHSGDADACYTEYLQKLLDSVENNCKDLTQILNHAGRAFKSIPVNDLGSKPVVVIVGEIFMRDNAFCSNDLVKRLEQLGAETMMAPFAEWVNYSTIRYIRDSRWKGNVKNLMKAKMQLFFQKAMEKKIRGSLKDVYEIAGEVEVEEMLQSCGDYISKDYDGDPPLAIGSAVLLADKQVDGVVNILPFTCMPGTINCTVSGNLRKNHHGLPWENFAYDGDDNIGLDTRFEAFMHQVKEYHFSKEMNQQKRLFVESKA